MTPYAIGALIICICACFATLIYLSYSGMSLAGEVSSTNNATLLNTFPGELTNSEKSKRKLVSRILAGAAAVLCLLAYGLVFGGLLLPYAASNPEFESNGSLPFSLTAAFLLLFGIAASVFMALTSFTPLSSIKQSLTSWSLLIFTTAGAGVFQAMITGDNFALMEFNQVPTYVAMAFGIILLATLLNPKIKDWAKMQKTEVNGATYWIRPKVNWFAVSVWLSYLVNALYMVLFVISICVGSAY